MEHNNPKHNNYLRASIARGIQNGKSGVFKDEKHDHGMGIVRGIAIMRKGFVKDERGWEIDNVTLDQVVELGNSLRMGLKSRFGHPNMSSTALGTFIGRVKNFSNDGDVARGDLFIDKTAYITPNGDLGSYILDLAENDPDSFGMSIVLDAKELEHQLNKDGLPKKDENGNPLPDLLRVKKLSKVDVVDDPAATDGFFDQYTDSVKLSATMTQFLDKFLQDDQAVEKAISFLNRYQRNKNEKQEEFSMDLKDLTISELQKERPDLCEEFVKKAKTEGIEQGVKEERDRVTKILSESDSFKKSGSQIDDLVLESVKSGSNVESALSKFKDHRIEELNKQAAKSPGPDIVQDSQSGSLSLEEKCRHDWDNNPNLRKDYSSFETYFSFMKYQETRK